MDLKIPAETISIDTDEGRYVLIIETDRGNTITVDFHSCSLDFYDEVRRKMRDYVNEAEWARATMPVPDGRDEYAHGVNMSAVERLERYAEEA